MATKKTKLYRNITEMNNALRQFDEPTPDQLIVNSGGLSGFWALIKEQGAQLRENKPVIPRNHVWEDDKPAGKGKRKGKK